MKLLYLMKTICISILLLSLGSCNNFLDKGPCCQQYVTDRTLFLDSLFAGLFPEKFEITSNKSYHTKFTRHLVGRSLADNRAFKYHPVNLGTDTTVMFLRWESSDINDSYLNIVNRYRKRPKTELIPRFRVYLFYKPDSICSTLTERWEFYSGEEFMYGGLMWADKYSDKYVIFDYIVKENKLTSKYSYTDLDEDILTFFGLETSVENNQENIKRVKDYGVLSFDTLMNWKENYLENVSMDCAK